MKAKRLILSFMLGDTQSYHSIMKNVYVWLHSEQYVVALQGW